MSKEFIYINEVGPRDGLQNQSQHVEVQDRVNLIKLLATANIPGIEVASFPNPKIVPRMAGGAEILKSLKVLNKCDISVLVPNLKGYELAKEAGASAIAVVPSSTDTFNKKNVNMSLKETIKSACSILSSAKEDNIRSRAYVSAAWECPYEGKIKPNIVLSIAEKMLNAGAQELILADTIGAANPKDVEKLFTLALENFKDVEISAHFHDTRAMALTNVWAALNCGIKKFDSSIGGLGGCPFAPGASGNLATEDLVHMLHQSGFETGIDTQVLNKAIKLTSALVNSDIGGRMTPWLSQQTN
jgi:hydroxymethylglutaryl-CoA lyase|tara:strand:+ start:2873 stop:3775 length:903 start_codon:yes stop_codon:yes gene_type:complete